MKTKRRRRALPEGGLARDGRWLSWRWRDNGAVISAPLRCEAEEWFGFCARRPAESDQSSGAAPGSSAAPRAWAIFSTPDGPAQRAIAFTPIERCGRLDWLGWTQAPPDARQLTVRLDPAAPDIEELLVRIVAERDPKCHPAANVPRWSTYRSAIELRRVLLAPELTHLADLITDSGATPRPVETLPPPGDSRVLAAALAGSACVFSPEWLATSGWRLPDLERVAANAWVLIDLESLARMVAQAGGAETEIATYAAPNEFMSARNEYADVPTRGLALFDCVPYGSIDERGRFFIRVLRATRAWKRYADAVGFATLLSSQTPWEQRCNDVVCAARPVGQGELIATDLPLLLSGRFGPPLAPRLAGHLLRMHTAAEIDPWAQFWCRGFDDRINVRDIADAARRFAPLRAVRWQSPDPRVAMLGLSLEGPAPGGRPARELLVDSGRIDGEEYHDGLPMEPFVILWRQMAREVAGRTAWANRSLCNLRLTWRFATTAGLRYAPLFDAAGPAQTPERTVEIAFADQPPRVDVPAAAAVASRLLLPRDRALFGEHSFELQQRIRTFIAAHAEALRD